MESIRVGLKKYAKKNGQKMPKRCCLEASMSNQRKMKSDSVGELIFNFTRRELENPWPFFLAWKLLSSGELARQRVGWSFDVFRSSRYCHRLLRRQKPDESSFFRLLPLFRRRAQRAAVSVAQSAFHSLGGIKTSSYDFYQLGLDRVDVYFCPHIFRDVSKELIFAPHSLSSSWCFRNVK